MESIQIKMSHHHPQPGKTTINKTYKQAQTKLTDKITSTRSEETWWEGVSSGGGPTNLFVLLKLSLWDLILQISKQFN